MRLSFLLSIPFGIGLFISSARADIFLTTPSVNDSRYGWNRGDNNSTFSGWIGFQDENADPSILDTTPDAPTTFGPSASVLETSGGAFVTGGNNLYSFSVPTFFEVSQPGLNLGTEFNTRIVALFETLGTELQYSSINLTGTAFVGSITPNFTQEIARTPLGGFGGESVTYLAKWDMLGNIGDYQLNFNSSSSSMSLDQFAIDTHATAITAVPEPASIFLLGSVATSAMIIRRFRSNKLNRKD